MLELDGEPLSYRQIAQIARGMEVRLAPGARDRMLRSRAVIDRIVESNQQIYGVNTGFGKLSDVAIPIHDLERLQINLVRSHACGMGDPLSEAEVRVMLLLRAAVLAVGFSGARPECAETMIAMLNRGVHPVVPELGSVGASGDLAPLAHLALVVIGEGEANFQGRRMPGREAMAQAGIEPLQLKAKEGLALLNGTQAIGAVGGLALIRGLRCLWLANVVGMMTLDALRDTPAAYDDRLQRARPHAGQIAVADHLREVIEGSEIRESHRHGDHRVQDAYSIRCMPQVHGAVLGALRHALDVLEIETASATDNPLVFAESGDVISGGNFHGAPLAYALDYAAIALTDLAAIIERRIERLVNPDLSEGLPAFLTTDAGTSSGFMIAQVAAAALLSECRVLAHPASVDNTPTSAGKEDHVSMGMTAALKLRRIVSLVERVLAIEMLAAAEGIDFRRPLKSSPAIEAVHQMVRSIAPRVDADRALGIDLEALAVAIRDARFDFAIASRLGA